MRRRHALRASACLLAGFAGCSSLSAESGTLNLHLFNHADTAFTVELAVFDTGGDQSRSEARLYDATVDVPPNGDASRDAAVDLQRCLVRYSVYGADGRLTDEDHVHYYPPDGGETDDIAFDLHAAGELTRR